MSNDRSDIVFWWIFYVNYGRDYTDVSGFFAAGVFCAIVSHPADTVVSKLNQAKGSSALDVAKNLGFAGK
jgi:hypothetical protein